MSTQLTENTGELSPGLNWGTVQLAAAIVVACLPTYKSLLSSGVFSPSSGTRSWYASLKGKTSKASTQASTLDYDRSSENSHYYNCIGIGRRGEHLSSIITTIGGTQTDRKNVDTHPLRGISVERTVRVTS